MKAILFTVILVIAITIGTSGAALEEDWAHGRRNIAPDGIEYVYYDFEEGSNCATFNNQFPSIATFLTVLGTQPYGCDEPSYSTVGGSTCGNTRCYMNIYPYSNQQDWIYIVNGHTGFNPITGPDHMGGYYPAMNAHIVFKPGTHYISFLASTGGNLYVRLYDKRGNVIHYDKITCTIMRNGTEPSNFTRFSAYIPDTDIVAMKFRGSFNAWHVDDMIVGGVPGYLPIDPFNYSYVAERALELEGVPYLEYGLGHDWILKEYLDSKQLQDGDIMEYWNPDIKVFEKGTGISDEGLILWAYNYDSQELAGTSFVKWCTSAGMEKHDFIVDVDPGEAKPGDVVFIDVDGDGIIDTVGIVVPPNEWGDDILTSTPGNGVQYWDADDLTGVTGYKRLDSNIKGGHNPIPGH